MNDPIIDLIIRIKNAYMTKNDSLVMPHSSYREAVVKKLQDMRYIKSYSVEGDIVKSIEIDCPSTHRRFDASGTPLGIILAPTVDRKVFMLLLDEK